MKIAITGGTGFLGKYVAEQIKIKNNIPIVLTRNILEEFEESLEHRFTDYTKEDLKKKLSDIEAVIHLAAKRGSQGLISEFHENEVLTQNLYETCYDLNIKNIVYASSISVYSDESLLPWTELQIPGPRLMYGISKLANEHIGNIYSEKYNLRIKNLRFAHIFGFNEKNNYMINRFFRQAFIKEKLIINGESLAKREFIYAKDAAKAIVKALNKKDLAGTFNIGSGTALTNLEVAQAINKIFLNVDNLEIRKTNEIEVIKSSFMHSKKAEKILNFQPDYSFPSAITEIFNLMKELDDVPSFY